jgi:hypothetical protein
VVGSSAWPIVDTFIEISCADKFPEEKRSSPNGARDLTIAAADLVAAGLLPGYNASCEVGA